jgi:nucleotide-binding universal stress UspA family protein
MYRHLLVPLDGSPFGEHALSFAWSIAQQSGAALHLVHVHAINDPICVEGMPVIDVDWHTLGREHERAYLAHVRDRLLSTAQRPIVCANPDNDGSIAGTLAQYVVTNQIDLVVMTTHGRGGLARAWLGSVADALVRCSPAPLLLLRPGPDPLEITKIPLFQRVLIPLDGSALSEQILGPALALDGLAQAEYTLLRVAEPFVLTSYAPLAQINRLDEQLTQEGLSEARAYVKRVAERLCVEGRTIHARALLAEQPAAAILDEAHRQEADLIAMTTHGHSGLARLLLGSVADKVLRGATLPMLIARPQS